MARQRRNDRQKTQNHIELARHDSRTRAPPGLPLKYQTKWITQGCQKVAAVVALKTYWMIQQYMRSSHGVLSSSRQYTWSASYVGPPHGSHWRSKSPHGVEQVFTVGIPDQGGAKEVRVAPGSQGQDAQVLHNLPSYVNVTLVTSWSS